MKYHLAALLIFSFCFLINRSEYIACCSITLRSKHFFSDHRRCYVQLIFVVDYLKDPLTTYPKTENKLIRNFKKGDHVMISVLLQMAALSNAREVLK